MKFIRQRSRLSGIFLVLLMLLLATPRPSVLAAMITTEATFQTTPRDQDARSTIKAILAREDARAVLIAQGIDPLEAMARVDSLTDAEARRIADQFEKFPAAGGFITTFIIVVGIIVIVLVITDALGYTNVFTFIR